MPGQVGQRSHGEPVPNWDERKLQVMFLLNCAKYSQHLDLQQQVAASHTVALFSTNMSALLLHTHCCCEFHCCCVFRLLVRD